MTRLLYWNIENFGINKLHDIKNPQKKQRHSSLKKSEASKERKNLVEHIITRAHPDIFILVEVETGYTGRGQLISDGGGREGAIYLCRKIRRWTGNQDWMLVPPIQTGPKEAVAIFYNSSNRYFTGPYIWPGGNVGPVSREPGAAPPGDYPDEFKDTLPDPRTIPEDAGNNKKVIESQVAARVAFTYKAGHLNAGTAVDFGIQRAPYMATFYETAPVKRNITIFAIHSPASFNARAYLRDLAEYAQVVDVLAPNEVRVVVGDLNWNLLRIDGSPPIYKERDSYRPLRDAHYDLALQPVVPGAAMDSQGYRSYFATHIRPIDNAEYWSTSEHTYYPGYAYFSNGDYALDNIFTRYGTPPTMPPAAAGGPAANFTILNPIVGSPYTKYLVPVPKTPQGSVDIDIDMKTLKNPPQTGQPFSVGLRSKFISWEEYGHIRSVSDHLPLAIDI